MKSNLVAIVPARSGSKRIPQKNTRPFFGRPMLTYAVSAALNSGLFREVVVSSDDPAVAHMVEPYGATFVLRPPELATDSASLVDVARHVLGSLRARCIEPEALCQCMPNCPLVRSRDIVNLWHQFESGNHSFQISVVPYRGLYPHWAVVAGDNNQGRWLFGDNNFVRSQELSKAYCPTGAIWWARAKDFLEQNAFYGSPFALAPMDANRGLDIDDEEDIKLAELLVHGLTVRDNASPLEPMPLRVFAEERIGA
ncbi:MAG: acylneuraminate cytidylyltransferase family protein [Candidatus Sulfotelmatobacter sp.]